MPPRCAASQHCGGQRLAETVNGDRLFDSRRLRVALQFLADPRHAEHAAEAVKEKWKVRRFKKQSPLLARWTTALRLLCLFFVGALFEDWNSLSAPLNENWA